jgi:hypothetical protein
MLIFWEIFFKTKFAFNQIVIKFAHLQGEKGLQPLCINSVKHC